MLRPRKNFKPEKQGRKTIKGTASITMEKPIKF